MRNPNKSLLEQRSSVRRKCEGVAVLIMPDQTDQTDVVRASIRNISRNGLGIVLPESAGLAVGQTCEIRITLRNVHSGTMAKKGTVVQINREMSNLGWFLSVGLHLNP